MSDSRTYGETMPFDSCSKDAFAAGTAAAAMTFNHDEDPRVAFGAPSLTIASDVAKRVMLLGCPGVGTLDILGDDVNDGCEEGDSVAITQEL